MISGWNNDDFDGVKSGEMLDFSGGYRMGYRSKNGGLGVDGRDMPFPVIEHSFQNVNHAPFQNLHFCMKMQIFLFCGLTERFPAPLRNCHHSF